MVTNKASRSGRPSRQDMAAHKHVKLKAHHAKPYRKRHVVLLVASIAALILLATILVSYRDQIVSGLASSRSFVSDLFVQDKKYDVTVNSSYGFNLTYNQKIFYASGIDNATGDLHIGSELSQERAYTIIRVAPNFNASATNSTTNSALTMTLHPAKATAKDNPEAMALQDGGLNVSQLTRTGNGTATLGGEQFQRSTWQTKSATALAPSLSAKFVTYSGLVNGNVVTIVVSLGINATGESAYASVINSISFNNELGYVAAPSDEVIAKVKTSRSLLDTLTNTNVAAAATNGSNDLTGSEKVAALYSPAVVKIYNAYCMDISIDGKSFLKDSCSAASGSGFFLSQDGYLGTNGHVAATKPLDLVIASAISALSTNGDPQPFTYLLGLTSLKESDIPSGSTDDETIGIMIDALYKIDTSRITVGNDVENLLVQVTAKNPDITALLQDTKDRKTYTGDASVLKATLKAADYRANDGYNGFKASDVAIIKVEGTNFPVVKLGSIDSVTQGADLSILGYPGSASDNGIVDSTSSEATLTTGKVSAKKNASNSDKRLIETDTTIGHGNSGGPALDDDGSVVGIATYTADGSGDGDGIFNYIRDIKDLTDLAASNNITFDTNSATQTEWQKGISYFYSSHYTKALASFQKVKILYPNDSRVAEFIAASQTRIANGENVVDFPLIPVLIAAAVIILGIGVGAFQIVRHHKKHLIYTAGVAQGTVIPAGPGVPTQKVFVSQASPTVDSPVTSTTTVEVTTETTQATPNPVVENPLKPPKQ